MNECINQSEFSREENLQRCGDEVKYFGQRQLMNCPDEEFILVNHKTTSFQEQTSTESL